MEQAHIIVSGIVQGVFFRAYTQQEAIAIGVTGWVRNTPDGDVEILAQGTKEQLERLIVWCHKGSPSSKVENVAVTWEKPGAGFGSFSIRH